MKRSLELLEEEFLQVLNLPNESKNECLVQLMNYLEKHYYTFIINPTTEDLKRDSVKLYQRVSNSRDY